MLQALSVVVTTTIAYYPIFWLPVDAQAVLQIFSPQINRHYKHAQEDNTLTILCMSIRGGDSETSRTSTGESSSRTSSLLDDKANSHERSGENESGNAMTGDKKTNDSSRKSNLGLPQKLENFHMNTNHYFTSLQDRTLKAKQRFLDKIALVSTALLKSEHEAVVDNATESDTLLLGDEGNDDDITLQSDLLRPGRKIFVVTTAAIPWFTGTSVNPLLRAAYAKRMMDGVNSEYEHHNKYSNATEGDLNITTASEGGNCTSCTDDENFLTDQTVTLVIPWLELEQDRLELYGTKHNFTTPEDQELYIRKWLREEADMPEEADEKTGIRILFYPARYHSGLKSIFAMGDMASLIPDSEADICILEEPEHLNWYRAPGDGWTKKFRFVIGIIHTNYVEYASSHYTGLWTAPAIRVMSSAMVKAYCHVVIKLSDTLQTFAEEKERTSNVHGVRLDFLKEGTRRAIAFEEARDNGVIEDDSESRANSTSFVCQQSKSESSSSPQKMSSLTSSSGADVYFIGKLLWAKGLDKMLELERYYKECTGDYFAIDVYGNGPEEKVIKRAFQGRSDIIKRRKDFQRSPPEVKTNQTIGITLSAPPVGQNGTNGMFSSHMAKLSRQLQATTETIKTSTKKSIDLESLPRSFYELRKDPIPSSFPGRVDHALLSDYKVFVNPSESEVLCTTTAEALAMGKFVIIPVHPSNTFFMQFDNCLPYRNKLEFAANLHWALGREPAPLSPQQRRLLTWEAATERLVSASAITKGEAKNRQALGTSKIDERIAWFHNELGKGAKGDVFRKILGAGPVSDQVAYESSRQNQDAGDEDGDGLSLKFVGSALSEAIRETLKNTIPGNLMSQFSPP